MCYRQTNTNTFKHTDRRVYDVYSQSHLKRGYDNTNPIPRDGFATEIYFVFEEKKPYSIDYTQPNTRVNTI